MSEFDIAQFANFKAPSYLCPRCLGIDTKEEIFGDFPENWVWNNNPPNKGHECNICSIKYVPTQESSNIHEYLMRWNCVIEHQDITARFKTLAEATADLQFDPAFRIRYGQPALHCLYKLLNESRSFVHFITWGLSWDFIGMLALLSHRVDVRGIVSSCDEAKANQIKGSLKYGGRGFEVIPLTQQKNTTLAQQKNMVSPHQKLIVIDGLVAITGSANLTINAWDNVDKGLEQIVIETRPEKVIELNNTLFSPVWTYFHPIKDNFVYMNRAGRTWNQSIIKQL